MPKILMKGLDIEHVYKEGKIITPVLKGVNLEIEASKMTAIVGKSGSGKSTLLHILGTLDTPTKGSVFFNDTNVTSLRSREKAQFRNRHMGFVYQFHHLLGDFTAIENVMLPLLIGNIDKKLCMERALYLLNRVGLEHLKDHFPSELSGGERQRVAIARALVHSPEVILADEPTGNLDEENASIVFKLFKELVRDEGTAVVMVTHDMSLARQCDHVFEIVGGVISDSRRFGADLEKENKENEALRESITSSAIDKSLSDDARQADEKNVDVSLAAAAAATAAAAGTASAATASPAATLGHEASTASYLQNHDDNPMPHSHMSHLSNSIQANESQVSAICDKEIVDNEVKAVIFDPHASPLIDSGDSGSKA